VTFQADKMVDLGFEATKHEPECKPELKPKKLFSRKIRKYLNKQVLSVCGVCVHRFRKE
jgi:hypothetical protein